jgi:Flp pilus assembly protein TadG
MAQVNSMTKRLRSERGAELIEFALIFPLLLLVLLGIIDFGFLFQRYEVLTNATREGARMAVLPNYSDDDIRRRICDFLITGGVATTGCPGTTPTNPAVTITSPTIALGGGKPPIQVRRVQLAYNHNFMFIGPIVALMGGSWTNAKTITTAATMRTELQAAAPPTP